MKTENEIPRRTGDAAKIDGSYQHRALTTGPAVQRFWHRSKLDLLDWMFSIRPTDDVLDVGCGSGVFSDALAKRGANVTGIDANEDAISYASKTFQRPRLTFRLGLLDEMQFGERSFDKAVCLEVIEHVYQHQARKLLGDMRRILRPGGQILLTTPNYKGVWPLVEWAADKFSSAAKMDSEQHITHFDRASLRALIESEGFSIERLRTYSTAAPFLAPISWAFASKVEKLERRFDLPFGNVLVAVATRRD